MFNFLEDIDDSNSVELNKDSNMNFNESSIHWFFSPKKQVATSPSFVANFIAKCENEV